MSSRAFLKTALAALMPSARRVNFMYWMYVYQKIYFDQPHRKKVFATT